jgi:hypothetical protein
MGASLSSPYFKGTSHVEFKGEAFDLACTGYHDHSYGTTDLLEAVRHWFWGRGYIPSPNGTMYLMYGDVEPQALFYGRMKYLILVPSEGATPLTDINFQIDASDYQKESKIKFPRKIFVRSSKLKTIFTLEFQESHFDQTVYNRSIFRFRIEGPMITEPLQSTACVEYYNMPKWLSTLIRPIVRFQYNRWLVD